MAQIELINVSKSFGKSTIIENLNLTIEDGSFTALVGPSGCGKTTLLRILAGIGPQTSGQVLIDGQDVTDIAPGKRGVAMVFQNYAIYPTMTVRENIEFGLKNNKIPRDERNRLINEICQVVGLIDFLDRMPSMLSGGQRQRIALARAMVKKPKVFLMDEPLSNLDAKLRVQMRVELIELHKRLGTTFVYVTHDQVEAMSMSSKIVLMNQGRIQQEDSPSKIYFNPHNIFTAQFIGTPPMNTIEHPEFSSVKVGFRPENVVLTKEQTDAIFSLPAKIATREMLGSETIYKLTTETSSLMVKAIEDNYEMDENVYFNVDAKFVFLFDGEGNRMAESHEQYEAAMKSLIRM